MSSVTRRALTAVTLGVALAGSAAAPSLAATGLNNLTGLADQTAGQGVTTTVLDPSQVTRLLDGGQQLLGQVGQEVRPGIGQDHSAKVAGALGRAGGGLLGQAGSLLDPSPLEMLGGQLGGGVADQEMRLIQGMGTHMAQAAPSRPHV